MAVEKVHEELEEVKFENEKLRVDLKCKAELCEHLKKFQNEQSTRIQETSSKLEKQAQQLVEKEEEISVVKRATEDLKYGLNEKESVIKQLNAANDKLRAERDEQNQKREQETRMLVLALDEANEKSIGQEQKINVLKEEIEGLKALLSVSQKKHSEAEKKAKNQKELRERDDLLFKVEEDMKKVEDKLKWKKEQFKHLEEAHYKLRDQYKVSEKEWEQEKSTFLDEISSLQTRLDSQIRIAGDLQTRLQMCNQALAHEETRRKYLEVEISEFKTRYENTFAECQDAKSQLACLNSQRDKEVASLRHLLGTKESFYKEMEYQAGKLEQENQELLASLKELREARIQKAGNNPSLSELKNKLKSVEQMHKECSSKLRSKEDEWNTQREEMTKKLTVYSSQFESKDSAHKVLEMELESWLSSAVQLKLQNEEISIMFLLLKSAMSETQLKLANDEAELSLHQKDGVKSLSILRQQLEMKTIVLANAQRDLVEECERTSILSRRVDTLAQLEDKHQQMEKEFDRCKRMLEESSKCQQRLKEQALQMGDDSKEKNREVCDALDVVNSELAEEREKVASLSRRVESLDLIEGQQLLMQKELERYKERLEEASRCQINLEEQALRMESESREKLSEVYAALETAKSELTKEREKTGSLTKRAEYFDLIEGQRLLMQKELERYKERLEEASRCQINLEEQALRMESESREKLSEVYAALETAKSELTKEREKTGSLTKRAESFDLIEGQRLLMQKELERYRERLQEASRCQTHLEVQVLQVETESREKLSEVCATLETAKSELTKEREKTASLTKRAESLDHIEEQWLQKRKEVERYKKMLEEASRSQSQIEEQVEHMKKEFGEKLRAVSDALQTANSELSKERESTASLMKSIESSDHLEKQRALMQKELDRYKEMFEESYRCKLQLEENFTQIESDSERKLAEAHNALEKANSELVEKICEGHGIEFESLIWKSIAKRLKVDLEESQELHTELEASFLAQAVVGERINKEKDDLLRIMEEKDQKILNLQQQIMTLEQELQARELEAVSSAESILHMAREHNISLEDLLKEIDLLEEESLRRELEAAVYAHIASESILLMSREHDISLEDLRKEIDLLEEESLRRELEAAAYAHIASESILHMAREHEISLEDLRKKIDLLEEESLRRELEAAAYAHIASESILHMAREHDISLEDLRKEIDLLEEESLRRELEAAVYTHIASEASVDELKSEKANILEDIMELSAERENLVGFIGGMSERINEFSSKDTQLMGILGRIVQSFDNNPSDLKGSNELYDFLEENENSLPPPATKNPIRHQRKIALRQLN